MNVNVDFHSGGDYYLLGSPSDLLVPVFVIGRVPCRLADEAREEVGR